MSAQPDKISELHHCVKSCKCDVNAWASANMLKLNDNKTGFMFFTSKVTTHLHNLPTSFTIGNDQIPIKLSVKKLGSALDCHLTVNAQVSNIARICYIKLGSMISICRLLASSATASIASAFCFVKN